MTHETQTIKYIFDPKNTMLRKLVLLPPRNTI